MLPNGYSTSARGVKFSNGKALDADDCIYSIQIHRGETKSPAKGILEQIKEIKALSPTQVGITLASGNADFPVILGDYHLVVVPKDFTDWQKPIGTGAYTLESFEPGVRLVFKNRGDYWKPGRGNFDTVELRNIQDVAARTAALQSGEIDAANRLDARTVKLLMADPNLNIVRTKGTGNRFCFVARVTDEPYTNKDLRTGAEVRHRPREDHRAGLWRLRGAGQRPQARCPEPVLQHRNAAE